jgi:glycerol kinase
VSHDPEEIYQNAVELIKGDMEKNGVKKSQIQGVVITNQREITVAWNSDTSV